MIIIIVEITKLTKLTTKESTSLKHQNSQHRDITLKLNDTTTLTIILTIAQPRTQRSPGNHDSTRHKDWYWNQFQDSATLLAHKQLGDWLWPGQDIQDRNKCLQGVKKSNV